MKKRILLGVALVLIPLVTAQVTTVPGHVEQFDQADDTTPDSLGDWWSVLQGGNEFHINNEEFMHGQGDSSYCARYAMTSPPSGADWVLEFEALIRPSATGHSIQFVLHKDTGTCNFGAGSISNSDCGNDHFSPAVWSQVGNDIQYQVAGGAFQNPSGVDRVLYNIAYNDATGQITTKTDRGDNVVDSGCQDWADLPAITFRRESTQARSADTVGFDNLRWDNGTGVVTELGSENLTASEFSTGLEAFFEGVGFQSGLSKVFLTVILVGLATVLAGRFSNTFKGFSQEWIVHGVATLVGVFAILLGWLELWKFIIILIVSTTIIRGIPDINTTLIINAEDEQREPENGGIRSPPIMNRESDSDGDDL